MIRKHFLRRAAAVVAGLLAVTSVLAVPASAEIAVGDLNGDGIVNVYDYILAKRVSVEESAPVSMKVSSAEGYAGKTVRVQVSVESNPGFSAVYFKLSYSPELSLADGEHSIRINEEQFAEFEIGAYSRESSRSITFFNTESAYSTEDGALAEIEFLIDKNTVPGTICTVNFEALSMKNDGEPLPQLNERGKIRVLPPPASRRTTALKGADVSQWQGDIDWEAFAANSDINYVMLRAGFGKALKQADKKFRRNYEGAKAAGLPVGAYWYSYAMTPAEAVLEAHTCAEVIKGCVFEYPVAFDFEEPKQLKLPVEKASAIIDAFCKEMESMGYYATLYCSSFYLNHTVSKEVRQRYDIWVAHYNVAKPSYDGSYGMWQYGVEGNKAGVSGAVDMNYCYRDYPEIMKYAGLNGCST